MSRTLLCAVCLENVVKHPKHYACPKCWHEHALKTNPEWFQGLIDEELARRRQEDKDSRILDIDPESTDQDGDEIVDQSIFDVIPPAWGGDEDYDWPPENLISPMTQEQAEVEVAEIQFIKERREKYQRCDPLYREYWNVVGVSLGERRALCVEQEIQAYKRYYGYKLTSEDGTIWLALFERKLTSEVFASEVLKRRAAAYRKRISTARKKIERALTDFSIEPDFIHRRVPSELLDYSDDPLFGEPIDEVAFDENGREYIPIIYENTENLPDYEKEAINWLLAIRWLREDPISAGKHFNMSSRDYCKWVANILRKLENSQK